MDFQLYDYPENNYPNLKNSWAIPSDGSMESNEEYFNWTSTDLKLALGASKQQYATNISASTGKFVDQPAHKLDRKRKYFSGNVEPASKVQIVDALKDPLELSPENTLIDKQSSNKRENTNGNGIFNHSSDIDFKCYINSLLLADIFTHYTWSIYLWRDNYRSLSW